MKIGIIGHGVVGKALEAGFHDHELHIYDKFQDTETLESVAQNSEIIFICLPTPMYSDEQGIDLSIIEDVIAELRHYTDNTDKLVVIKSTVIPGTTARLQQQYPQTKFCFNPEYLTEKNFIKDFLEADRTVIAGFDEDSTQRLVHLYKQQFPKTEIFTCQPTEAEMAKYMANCYLAVKVLFAYEMSGYCQALGVDYKMVKKIVTTDKRIYDSHLDIEGEDGFGGKCFPKDMVSLIGLGKKLAVDTSLLDTVWSKNKRIRKTHDWQDIDFAVSKKK